jgi:hypothetical protein
MVRLGLPAMTAAERRRRDRRRKAVELRAKGHSLRAIAAYLGVHHTTVMADLRGAVDSRDGNPPSPGGNPPPDSTTTNVIPLKRRAS